MGAVEEACVGKLRTYKRCGADGLGGMYWEIWGHPLPIIGPGVLAEAIEEGVWKTLGV